MPGGVGGCSSHTLGMVPRWGVGRRSGWQCRSQEISSPLILIACDGREIYGSEMRFVRSSSTGY